MDWQPIFYPVLNQTYAEQIAKEWNTEDSFSGYCGVVTRFCITEKHFQHYNVENVGSEMHNELWIPALELQRFNENIVGKIEVVSAFFGAEFVLPESNSIHEVLLKFRS